LIAEANRRIAAKTGEYYPKIFGIREVGGTSVLYISAVSFEKIGLRTNVPQEPLPALTWRALSAVPDVASVGATLLGGVYWITHRREKVAAEERAERRARKGGRQA
jgi:formate dehydrogenase iron-sulfur subunit